MARAKFPTTCATCSRATCARTRAGLPPASGVIAYMIWMGVRDEQPQPRLHILTLVTFAPLAGALLLVLLPRRDRDIRIFALVISLLTFVLSLHLPVYLHRGQAGFQYEIKRQWISTPNIHYHMGVDGISLWLVVLTTFLTPLCVLISWKSIHERVKEFFILLLILETALIGVFISLDLFLFYFFWEATLIPMALLIGVYGHGRKVYAAVKFFLYTMIASVFMLAAILWLYAKTGSFDFVTIRIERGERWRHFPAAAQWLFLGFFIAFAVKVPLFPFHTWLPDAHVEAPTAGSVLLAGVLLKMGTYGMLRFNLGLFPEQARANASWIVMLALIGIVYGALVAMVQPNMKKLIAYSSISHLGFVVLGIFSFTQAGLNGAMFVMLAHGVSTGGLFMLAGILYERRHTYEISEFGGLASIMPIYSTFLSIHRSRFGRTAAAQRIHRRIPGAERRIPGKRDVWSGGRDRRHLERRLSALDVPARVLRQGEASQAIIRWPDVTIGRTPRVGRRRGRWSWA